MWSRLNFFAYLIIYPTLELRAVDDVDRFIEWWGNTVGTNLSLRTRPIRRLL